jgi:hypothetical protein
MNCGYMQCMNSDDHSPIFPQPSESPAVMSDGNARCFGLTKLLKSLLHKKSSTSQGIHANTRSDHDCRGVYNQTNPPKFEDEVSPHKFD